MPAITVMQLIRKLRSPDNKLVLQAIEELRARGWLSDGSLEGVSLRYVHLQGADLHMAHLRGVNLHMAHLQGVDLSMANLQGARLTKANLHRADLSMTNLQGANMSIVNLQGAYNLSNEQLAQAGRLRGATMPDGSPYDGRFNLAGDLETMRFLRVDTNDPVAMADFYGVFFADYQRGVTIREITGIQLIRKLHSPDSKCVLQAVGELRARGWLSDGLLEGLNLRYVIHLQGTNLYEANLREVDLTMVNLQGANLWGANLQGAVLIGANLQGARLGRATFDENTTLPDDTKWMPDTDMARFTDPDHPDFWRPDA